MKWEDLISTNGVELTIKTPLYGGPQKVGISTDLGKLPGNISFGGVQYTGLNWTYTETSNNSVILTGRDEISEVGFYYEFKNNNGETVRNPDGSLKTTWNFGAAVEVGIISNGTSINDAAGKTIGAGGMIAIKNYGVGYSTEQDVESGLITNTISWGKGAGNIGVVVTAARVLELAEASVSTQVNPSLILKNSPIGDGQYMILNAHEDTGTIANEFYHYMTGLGPYNDNLNTAVAFEQNGEIVFYLRNAENEEYFYNPKTNQYSKVSTGIDYLGVRITSSEMNQLHSTMSVAAGKFSSTPVSIVTPSIRIENCFPAGTLITLADNTKKPIEDIRHGDIVLSHDKNGNLTPSIVDKLFTNTTDAFIRLSFTDGREDLIATPGHHFLTETGDYMEIGHMARLGGGSVRVVDTDGSIVTAKAERIIYSAETAEMFEQAQAKTVARFDNYAQIEEAA